MSLTDAEVATALDLLARSASKVRRLIPDLTADQFETLLDCCPWVGAAEDVLIQLDTWCVVAATEVRGVPDMIQGLGA